MYYFQIIEDSIERKLYKQIKNNKTIHEYYFSVMNQEFKEELESLGIKKYEFLKYFSHDIILELFLIDKFPEFKINYGVAVKDTEDGLYFIRDMKLNQKEILLITLFNNSDASKFSLSYYCRERFTLTDNMRATLLSPYKQKIE